MSTKIPERNDLLLLGTWIGHDLAGKCRCGRERTFDVAELAKYFGRRTAYVRLGPRMRCQECKRKGIELRVVLREPGGG